MIGNIWDELENNEETPLEETFAGELIGEPEAVKENQSLTEELEYVENSEKQEPDLVDVLMPAMVDILGFLARVYDTSGKVLAEVQDLKAELAKRKLLAKSKPKEKKSLDELIVEDDPSLFSQEKERNPGRPGKIAPRIRVPKESKPKKKSKAKTPPPKAAPKTTKKTKLKGKNKKR